MSKITINTNKEGELIIGVILNKIVAPQIQRASTFRSAEVMSIWAACFLQQNG
jgi:hypothetical protein